MQEINEEENPMITFKIRIQTSTDSFYLPNGKTGGATHSIRQKHSSTALLTKVIHALEIDNTPLMLGDSIHTEEIE